MIARDSEFADVYIGSSEGIMRLAETQLVLQLEEYLLGVVQPCDGLWLVLEPAMNPADPEPDICAGAGGQRGQVLRVFVLRDHLIGVFESAQFLQGLA